jgi:YD repeat-containing protein
MTGIKTVRAYYRGKLREFKAYDPQGNLIFEKSAASVGMLSANAYEYDAQGKPTRTLNCVIMDGTLAANELIYSHDSIFYWQATYAASMRAGADAAFSEANLACTMEGFPNSREELLSHRPLLANLKGERVQCRVQQLNAQGNPVSDIGYDEKGVARFWETSTYDAQGHCIRTTERQSGVTENESFDDVMEYDADGNEIKKLNLLVYGPSLIDTQMVVTSEYVDGRIVKRSSQSMFVSKVETFEYDAQHHLVRENWFEGGVWTPSRYYLYTRDAAGLPLEEKPYVLKSGTPTLLGVSTWEYERW